MLPLQATEARLEALEADNDVGDEQGAADSDDEEFMVAGDEDEEEGKLTSVHLEVIPCHDAHKMVHESVRIYICASMYSCKLANVLLCAYACLRLSVRCAQGESEL